jgi:hypothetical protein
MNPKRLTLPAAAIVLIVVLGFFALPKRQLHQGKTVRQWIQLLDPNVENQKQRDEASWALVQIGAGALPELQRILAWRPGPKETLREYAVRFRILKPHPISPIELQSRACEAAYNLAERADVDIGSLVPHLRYHFTNLPYLSPNSGRALAGAGPNGFSVLTNLLFTGTPYVQGEAGWSLGHIRTRPDVIAALVRYANQDPSLTQRFNGLIYLHNCNGPAELIVPLGLKYLRSESDRAQAAAARLLEGYKEDEKVRKALENYRAKNSTPTPAGEVEKSK